MLYPSKNLAFLFALTKFVLEKACFTLKGEGSSYIHIHLQNRMEHDTQLQSQLTFLRKYYLLSRHIFYRLTIVSQDVLESHKGYVNLTEQAFRC